MRPIVVVAGTRPEIIKLVPILEHLERSKSEYLLLWSGQHYDYEMSKVFFRELDVPRPLIDLGAGSGSHAEQTAKIMLGLEKVLKDINPSFVVAEGDTNTVVAAALTSAKMRIPFSHVEAGLRSYSNIMPEEINRRVADAIANVHFAPTKLAALNLVFEGVPRKHIYVVGNTIVDAVYKWRDKAENAGLKLLKELELGKYDYALVTVHRAENTDDPDRLSSILIALNELSKKVDVVYPTHPRTLKKVRELGLEKHLDRIRVLKPLGYLEFLGLLMHARIVLTDSGGVQEEAFTLSVPTLTLRYNTERPETTLFGINVLAGTDSMRIVELALIQAQRFEEIKSLKFDNPLGDGRAGERIVKILIELQAEKFFMDPDLSRTPFATYRLIDKNSFDANAYYEMLVCFDDEGTPILEDSESCSRRLVRRFMRLEGALP